MQIKVSDEEKSGFCVESEYINSATKIMRHDDVDYSFFGNVRWHETRRDYSSPKVVLPRLSVEIAQNYHGRIILVAEIMHSDSTQDPDFSSSLTLIYDNFCEKNLNQ